MSSNENSRMEYESGITPFAMSALTDSGDSKKFNATASQFSQSPGNAPVIRPNGILTGGAAVPGTADDTVDIAASTVNLNGVIVTVPSATLTIPRAASDVASVASITVTAGGAYVLVAGVDSADTTFSEVRGDPGAPELIPIDSVEISQVRVTTDTSAKIAASEIFAVPGTHCEHSGFPIATADNATGSVSFDVKLPAIHVGDVPKAVFASYAEPVYTEQRFSNDFVPAETTHTTTSIQVYSDTIGSSTQALNQASFTAILNDGITDPILARKNETLWFRYFQDRLKSANILTQGKLGISRTFGAADNPTVTCTISPDFASIDKA